jgi:hypothetical protein|tara:strand:- start:38581 stop:38880 length:300 start_codon:yes stop_codon:yes gene_type:complete
VALAGRVQAASRRDHQLITVLLSRTDGLILEMQQMGTVAYVKAQLEQTGVAPYLVDAGIHAERDVKAVVKTLKCSTQEAIQYILRGTIGNPTKRSESEQ